VRRESGTALGTRGVLVFPVGEILFGAPVEEVAGLIEGDHIAPLPGQNGPTAGVLAFRGSMIPALDLCVYLDVPAPPASSPRYGIVLSRGVERFALLIPTLPRLIPGKELKEAEVAIADAELTSVVGTVYSAGGEQVHCLRYWTIFESVMPPVTASRADTAMNTPRRSRHAS
jgi:chemotaxis signal transduction protein